MRKRANCVENELEPKSDKQQEMTAWNKLIKKFNVLNIKHLVSGAHIR